MELVRLLKKHSLKATPQRLCVLRVLNEHTHPCIDELFERVRAQFPSISLATVYKTLKVLQEQGLVVAVNAPNHKTNYDIYAHPHIHIICSKCAHIEDLEFDEAEKARFSEHLEKRIGNFIEDLGVCAYVSSCKVCNDKL